MRSEKNPYSPAGVNNFQGNQFMIPKEEVSTRIQNISALPTKWLKIAYNFNPYRSWVKQLKSMTKWCLPKFDMIQNIFLINAISNNHLTYIRCKCIKNQTAYLSSSKIFTCHFNDKVLVIFKLGFQKLPYLF